jgi:hypothetical protein
MAKVKAVTTYIAAQMYPGRSELSFQKMCLRGKRLQRLYGDKVPNKSLANCLMASKVGKSWSIPVAELERVFNS